LSAAEAKTGPARSSALTTLAAQLDRYAGTSTDAARVKTLAAQVRDLARH
jgi:hypothetical protein